MKKNRKTHYAGRIVSLLLILCMVLSIAPVTAFASGNTMYRRVEVTANVILKDSGRNTVSTKTITKTGDYYDYLNDYSDDEPAKVTNLIKAELPEGTVTETPSANATIVTDGVKYYDENGSEVINVGPGNYSYFVGYETLKLQTDITVQLSGSADWNIALVDFGNVWKQLDSTQPVTFTTELNPNFDCPNQMEISFQSWATGVGLNANVTAISVDASEESRYPVAGEVYRYRIVLTAKDGYVFPQDRQGLYDGNIVIDGQDVTNNESLSTPVSEDGKTLIVSGYPMVTATDGGSQDDENAANYTICEYWEECVQTENGMEPVKFWYSNADQMNSVPADKAITAFEEGKTYSYSVIANANDNYSFASKDALSVMVNGENYTNKIEVILDGKGLMIGPGKFMSPTKPVEQKEIELIEINNATVSFKAGDKPVFTGTVADGALYAIDYEGWFGADNEFISSSDYWNSSYVDRGWCDGLISSFKANTEYTYQLYLKLTDEAVAQGYVFGSNTKLKVNGETVEYPHLSETGVVLQIGTNLTMTPTAAGASDYKIIEGANGTWTQNSDGTLTFRANGDFDKFIGVKVDGTLIDAKNYTAVSGSTVITLKADYLKTLSAGTHKITVVYTDGECSANFEVKKVDTSPQTGDNSNLALWFAVLFACGAGMLETVVYGKRKKRMK